MKHTLALRIEIAFALLVGAACAADVQAAAPNAAPATRAASYLRLGTAKSDRATMIYDRDWGVDKLRLRIAASGSAIAFSYRVLDPNKAQALNDPKATPALIDRKTSSTLEVPTMEKVGKLRQVAAPAKGRSYWMVFSNPHRTVKRGDFVDIVIGTFRANGLVVE